MGNAFACCSEREIARYLPINPRAPSVLEPLGLHAYMPYKFSLTEFLGKP